MDSFGDDRRISHRSSRLDTNSLLSGGLLALLLIAYSALAYVAIVVFGMLLVSAILGQTSDIPWWLTGLALAGIAFSFWPVGRWLRHRVSDLVYGQHDDPYVIVSHVNRQLQAMIHPQLSLPAVAETIATLLKLPYVAFESTASDPPVCCSYGKLAPRAEVSEVPITYLGAPLGRLLAAGRGGQPLSASDLALLHDVAQRVGVALHVTRLTANLQAAREQLVIAREEERRRIRNDLHDDLAPTLSSLQLQLGVLRRLVHQDPAQASAIADDLREDLRRATAEIRQLVYDLRPPMLDELGLVAALKNIRFDDDAIRIEVQAPEPMPRLSAAVEVAVYRIASEAIHNVVKHAQATNCSARIDVADGLLTLSVNDDGRGLSSEYTAGIGVQSMQERAAELGGNCLIQPVETGGTQVVAHLPLGA